jgi:hypothetical protein
VLKLQVRQQVKDYWPRGHLRVALVLPKVSLARAINFWLQLSQSWQPGATDKSQHRLCSQSLEHAYY